MATPQRSREAILRGAKEVIAEVGSYESNMVDISAHAEVSRATVYNHFLDKEEMLLTLIESEINRLAQLAKSTPSKEGGLFQISRAISEDPALRRMVETDPEDIAKFVRITNHPLWDLAKQRVIENFGAKHSSLILHWLISQIASPLSQSESLEQAQSIAQLLA
jgi:AcrR family transcriptional regulator